MLVISLLLWYQVHVSAVRRPYCVSGMHLSHIIFGVALIAFSCVAISQSIKCFTCDNKESCKKPKSEVCNVVLANKTRAYMDLHHIGVNTNLSSTSFDCFREEIKSTTGEYHYKGCMYSNIAGCSYALREFHTIGKYSRDCNQCTTRDGCNPAGRAGVHLLTLLGAIVVGVTGRRLWS